MPSWSKKQPKAPPFAKNVLLKKLLTLDNPSNTFRIGRPDETNLFIEQQIVDAEMRRGFVDSLGEGSFQKIRA